MRVSHPEILTQRQHEAAEHVHLNMIRCGEAFVWSFEQQKKKKMRCWQYVSQQLESSKLGWGQVLYYTNFEPQDAWQEILSIMTHPKPGTSNPCATYMYMTVVFFISISSISSRWSSKTDPTGWLLRLGIPAAPHIKAKGLQRAWHCKCLFLGSFGIILVPDWTLIPTCVSNTLNNFLWQWLKLCVTSWAFRLVLARARGWRWTTHSQWIKKQKHHI